LVEFWGWTTAAVTATLVWLWGLRRASPWLPALAGWGLLVGTVLGAGAGLAFPLLLLAALGLLAAWDLSRLESRLALVKDPGAVSEVVYGHLKPLGAVLLAALLLGLLVGSLDLELSFAWIVGLALLAVILLRTAISLAAR